ncbi:prolyl aminopeptidase [Saccharopolyspora sp. 5N102]|uniref:prolyl aminopeptidase n=1 Tax=Saccharopolyspora sp. 5N102 TaxID=3375155 RepID=UPI0037A43C47
MRTFYPELEPHAAGHLDVGDGNLVYWEECGNPHGKPVVFVHGGPGAGCTPAHRRLFRPDAYRIVLFDQRGCGRSTPSAGAADGNLATNTTWHLVADMERLREHLGIQRWQVFGGSWGSTLALAYAQTHPDRVSELVLRGVFTVRRSELDWSYAGGSAHLFPEQWHDFLAAVPEAERGGDLLAAYHRLLDDLDPAVHEPAAIAWSAWEGRLIALRPRPDLIAEFTEPGSAVPLARIENHYFRHRGWLEEGQLIRDAGLLSGIPGVIVQGRYDVLTPPGTAWELARAWGNAELTIVEDAGHAFDEPGILDGLIAATDRFAGRA